MNIILELIEGIANGGHTSLILPKGLMQNESCLKCAYGGENLTVNFCKRPLDQKCHKAIPDVALTSY